MDEFVIPDLPEPITAWRVWTVRPVAPTKPGALAALAQAFIPVDDDTPMLHGMYGTPWPTNTLHAECRSDLCSAQRDVDAPCPHPPFVTVPAGGSHPCGIYALKSREQAVKQAPRGGVGWYGFVVQAPPVALGRVLVWGRVFDYEVGYRAEYCRIEALIVGRLMMGCWEPAPELTEQMCEAYGVPPLMSEEAEAA